MSEIYRGPIEPEPPIIGSFQLAYNTTAAYNYSTYFWNSDNYRTIDITGGTDSTNLELIAFLALNATQTS